MDFITDGLATGRMVRILSVVAAFTRECLALEADTSLGIERVIFGAATFQGSCDDCNYATLVDVYAD